MSGRLKELSHGFLRYFGHIQNDLCVVRLETRKYQFTKIEKHQRQT